MPQIGAVLVPLNYRLTADDFAYMINHCGARVVCAHEEYLAAVDSIRGQLSGVDHFVALDGSRARLDRLRGDARRCGARVQRPSRSVSATC